MSKQDVIGIIAGTLAGTTLMTIFSYGVSRILHRQYTEPVLLNRLLYKLGILKEYQIEKHFAGWIIHYFIGLLFILAYLAVWSATPYDPTIANALLLGCLSGLTGIAGWMVMFSIQGVPPNIDVREYYAQLFIAHIIFAVTATVTYARIVT